MIRVAGPGDVPAVLELVRSLAEYEREPSAVAMTAADLHRALFGAAPSAYCLVAADAGAVGAVGDAEERAADRDAPATQDRASGAAPPVVGFAIWHPTFSTWTGQAGMYLVDLFVRPEHRHSGHGRALLSALAAICVRRGYRRLEWAVLDWNTPAQGFYRALAAGPMPGWTTWRLAGDALTHLAADA
ncbi:diamine N-acetyltransferase [Frankia sp. AiPs1]|uniref:GNAT family N-acetyltransferase n=1 Tax=Frankia sp. AiPa1 TaxID=573492 RepID=UPI00202B7BF2|nr:GNAT family N-acetyltransferase [Frankia sp. AiPa1]MCL9761231.1 GNAT family N-acetyltransferase [Frankia sp. AiPa1]